MDLGGVDVWGQIALETSQMYVEEGGVIKSRFASTVSLPDIGSRFLFRQFRNTKS